MQNIERSENGRPPVTPEHPCAERMEVRLSFVVQGHQFTVQNHASLG
jgi:hypothetical protein